MVLKCPACVRKEITLTERSCSMLKSSIQSVGGNNNASAGWYLNAAY